MKITTANIRSPAYTAEHEIYVGTHTGSFKSEYNFGLRLCVFTVQKHQHNLFQKNTKKVIKCLF